jgi:sortase A
MPTSVERRIVDEEVGLYNKHMLFLHNKHNKRSLPQWARVMLIIVSITMLLGGGYLLFLTLSPSIGFVPTPNNLDTTDDVSDRRNRIQIEKIDLEVPYNPGGVEALNEGAWWRHPQRGNPAEGGNFILSAHRFYIGLTPEKTRARSPFYRLEEVNVSDNVRAFYEGEWYDYKVTKKYTVKPDAVEIEAPSDEAKMTLYTCTLGGSADGRVVLEAEPL